MIRKSIRVTHPLNFQYSYPRVYIFSLYIPTISLQINKMLFELRFYLFGD